MLATCSDMSLRAHSIFGGSRHGASDLITRSMVIHLSTICSPALFLVKVCNTANSIFTMKIIHQL
jgi:hypothetical protein